MAGSLPSLNLGFLTLLQEGVHCIGGYLVTNLWGRPLEFRVSTAVQPNRVQQILFGRTLSSYVFADIIGKALIEKTSTPAKLIITDREPALDVRFQVGTPVVWLADSAHGEGPVHQCEAGVLLRHPRFAEDEPAIKAVVEKIDPSFDFAEPLTRVREAIVEARKMGMTTRNAA